MIEAPCETCKLNENCPYGDAYSLIDGTVIPGRCEETGWGKYIPKD